jgi:predicted nucleic acid-binding protein
MVVITFATGSRIYLDANIFIYAAETPGAFPSLITLLKRLDNADLLAVTSTLTLAEVLVAPIRSGNTSLESLYRNRISNGSTITVIDPSRDILIRAASIRAGTPAIKLPDAIYAATCLTMKCDAFLTSLPVALVTELA